MVRSRSLVLQGTHGALVMPLRGTADMIGVLKGLRLRLIWRLVSQSSTVVVMAVVFSPPVGSDAGNVV